MTYLNSRFYISVILNVFVYGIDVSQIFVLNFSYTLFFISCVADRGIRLQSFSSPQLVFELSVQF